MFPKLPLYSVSIGLTAVAREWPLGSESLQGPCQHGLATRPRHHGDTRRQPPAASLRTKSGEAHRFPVGLAFTLRLPGRLEGGPGWAGPEAAGAMDGPAAGTIRTAR